MALAVALVGGACGDGGSASPDAPDVAHILWQDEFDGPAGQSPDPSRWGFDVGGGGWGNRQLEYDTARATNVALDGQGRLAITARAEPYMGRSYTSARIHTKARFAQLYGYLEARIRLPVGQGIWPAFWALGNDIDGVGWPTCGEIDIMEYRGQAPEIVHGSLHGPGYSGGEAITATHRLGVGLRYDTDFHVFAVEWSPERIEFMVDGTVYEVVTPGDLPTGARWVFDHPFFFLLNVAVGGDFVGSPDQSTTFPQVMLVDYVRVYDKTPTF